MPQAGRQKGPGKEYQAWALGIDGDRAFMPGLSTNALLSFVDNMFYGGKPMGFPGRYGEDCGQCADAQPCCCKSAEDCRVMIETVQSLCGTIR